MGLVRRVDPRPGSLDSTLAYADDGALHYGQKFRLQANPACVEDPASPPLFLKSAPVARAPPSPAPSRRARPETEGDLAGLRARSQSLHHFAKLSRHQEVSFSSNATGDALWTVVTPDPARHAVSLGVPVLAGAPVLLQHVNTRAPLAHRPNMQQSRARG